MMPNNPTIMYNCLKSIGETSISCGMPIYTDKKKLAGIIYKFQNIDITEINNLNESIDISESSNKFNYVYCIPINYILIALNKLDNTKLYIINEDINNIYKINNYKIICGKIYCNLHKAYIPVESYITINSDYNSEYHITLLNGRRKKANIIEYNNNMTNNNIIVNNNNISLTLGFINWLKILDEIELIEKLLINKDTDLKWDKYNIITV
jgi:hypothetical protein